MRPFTPPVVAASLSGASNAEWARNAAPFVGGAILGGLAIDAPTQDAAAQMVTRGRDEFQPTDALAFMDAELAKCADLPLRPGWNIRAREPGAVRAAAAVCAARGAILEINAHCRQDEMCAVGAGEALLHDSARLRDHVWAAAAAGATVSVKVRTEVPGVDLVEVCRVADTAGADLIHVDAMDSEHVVGEIARATDAVVIANNGVRDRQTVREYAEYGADAVSVGRPSDEPAVLARVERAARDLLGRQRSEGVDAGAP